jgi:hypothetical protein
MEYAWKSDKTLATYSKRPYTKIPWVLTADGELTPATFIRKTSKITKYIPDLEFLGPVVANCGEFPINVVPQIDKNALQLVMYLWSQTKDDYPNQKNFIGIVIGYPSFFSNMSGLNIFVSGAEVIISKSGKSKYFSLAKPDTFDKTLNIYKRWLKFRERSDQYKKYQLATVISKWAISVTVIIVIAVLAFNFLPESVAYIIFFVTSYITSVLTRQWVNW